MSENEDFESFNIRDVPDQWFDVIQGECKKFIEETSIYPSELTIMIIQVIFQNFIYVSLSPENRNKFLVMVFDTFVQQFEEWDSEGCQEEDTSDT